MNSLEFGVTVAYPPVLEDQTKHGPHNLFDGDVLEFDHTVFMAKSNYPTTESNPQKYVSKIRTNDR